MSNVLPALIADLEQLIGLPAALRLTELYGGTRVWVPEMPTLDHPLVAAVGGAAAVQLGARYGGTFLTIPKCQMLMVERRNQEIRRRYDAGERLRPLAREYHLHVRTVERVLASSDRDISMASTSTDDSRQLKLKL